MTEPTDLDKIRDRRKRGVTWMEDGCPPADVDEPNGARATWIVLTRDVPALLDLVARLTAELAEARAGRRITERSPHPCPGCHPDNPDLRCIYPDGHVVHWDGARDIWLSPTTADDMALASARAEGIREGWRQAADALRVQAAQLSAEGLDSLAAVHRRAANQLDALASLTPDTEPTVRTWELPPEPGPEVTAVRDTGDGQVWLRHNGTDGHWWVPVGGDPDEDGTDWNELVAGAWPDRLVDATPDTEETREVMFDEYSESESASADPYASDYERFGDPAEATDAG